MSCLRLAFLTMPGVSPQINKSTKDQINTLKPSAMKKTTFLLGLILAATALLTAFSVKNAFRNDPEVAFEEFLQQFPAQQLPYSLDEKSLRVRLDHYVSIYNNTAPDQQYLQTERLDWKYYQFLPDLETEANFSRFPTQAEPVSMFATTDNGAFLYATSRRFSSGYATYYLSVFDKKGHPISSNIVGKVMPETIVSAAISASLQAELKTWRIEWKKDYGEAGLKGNKIKGLSYVESNRIDLTKPTPKGDPNRFKKLIAPPVIEEAPTEVEGVKSK